MCVHAETCGQQLALEHTGDLYSCDHYVEPGYLLGNIGDKHMLELIASPAQRKFGQDKHDTLTRYCLDCDVRFACNGECPKHRFIRTPEGNILFDTGLHPVHIANPHATFGKPPPDREAVAMRVAMS